MNKGFTPPLKRGYQKIGSTSNPFSGAGFTLLEILISITILSGIILVVSLFGFNVFNFSIFLGNDIVSQQEIQLTLKVMVSEIRSMTQSINGSYPLELVFQNSLVFYSDIDGDGFSDRVHYYLQGTTFYKGVTKPTGNPLIYDVTNEKITEVVHNIYTSAGNIFSYYDSSYTGSQAALSFPINIPVVRLIKVNLTVDPDPANTSSRANFSTQVNVRNL